MLETFKCDNMKPRVLDILEVFILGVVPCETKKLDFSLLKQLYAPEKT